MSLNNYNRKLKWPEFKHATAKQEKDPNEDASTVSGFSASYSSAKKKGDKYVLTGVAVSITFGSKSWAKKSARSNLVLLRHEQGHYDISAIAGRHMYREAQKLGESSQTLLQASFKDLYDSIMSTLQAINFTVDGRDGIYDTDTGHSKIQGAQDAWNDRIQTVKSDPDCKVDDLISSSIPRGCVLTQ